MCLHVCVWVCVTNSGIALVVLMTSVGEESDVRHMMSPEDFRPLVVPFKMEGELQDNPCPLPTEYQDKLAQRKE